MKWIEPSPRRIRYIKLRKLKRGERVLVGFSEGADVASERNANCRKPGNRDPASGALEDRPLLLKEMDEINNWARLVVQLYFGWFALQFTVNCVGMGWLLTRTGPMPWFASLIFLVFLGWNLMGTIGTVMVYKGLVGGDLRMKEVIETMTRLHSTYEDSGFNLRSPMPRKAIGIVFGFCTVTMFMSLAFWIVLFVTGR